MSRGPNVECSAALMRNKSQMGAELRYFTLNCLETGR